MSSPLALLENAMTGVVGLASLAAPEILFFVLALAGMALFGSGMLGPVIGSFFRPSGSAAAHLKNKLLELEQEEETTKAQQEEELELEHDHETKPEAALARIETNLRAGENEEQSGQKDFSFGFLEESLTMALEELMNLPRQTPVPGDLAVRVLCLAGPQGRLPCAVAALKDADVAWPEGALEAPMAEAKARKDGELCIQLHRAAAHLDIPRSSKDCELLLDCVEAKDAPTALRILGKDIVAQNPSLEISEDLGLKLIRAGVHESPGLTARILGRERFACQG